MRMFFIAFMCVWGWGGSGGLRVGGVGGGVVGGLFNVFVVVVVVCFSAD